jgi:hypothetical protein
MQFVMGINEAAKLAGTTRVHVRAAMAEGALDWKRFDGRKVTTEQCLRRWLPQAMR